jgi:Glutamate synthase domain 1
MAEKNNIYKKMGFPVSQGLYDPKNEHDACGFGFIANIDNIPKHEIVHQALDIVHKLDHRGAIGADPLAGDGAGILIQIPDEFFRIYFNKKNIELPVQGEFAVGMVFLPNDKTRSGIAKNAIEEAIAEEGQILIGWRDVPTDNSVMGESVKKNTPIIKQFFIKEV